MNPTTKATVSKEQLQAAMAPADAAIKYVAPRRLPVLTEEMLARFASRAASVRSGEPLL